MIGLERRDVSCGGAGGGPPEVVVLGGSGVPVDLVGGKAAAVDRMLGWGIDVPPTAVVTTAAYHALAAQPAVAALVRRVGDGEVVPAEEVDATFAAATIPTSVADALAGAVATIADPGRATLAVRSSATVEDMGRSSFAGQYRSVLDVDATDAGAVQEAVLLVFASLLHPAPCAYRRALGLDGGDLAMAVMIMPMVPAVRAGVLFTQDPSGPEGASRIEWLEGSAEPLVSGRATPHAVTLDRTAAATGLSEEIPELLAVARRLAERAGEPQDIEWVWDGTRLWVVQARPITVAPGDADPFDEGVRALDGVHLTVTAIGEMLPGVLPPLRWEIGSYLLEEGFRTMLDRLGAAPTALLDARGLIRRVHGRAALDADRLLAITTAVPGMADRLRPVAPVDPAPPLPPDAPAATGAAVRHRRAEAFTRRAAIASARRRGTVDADIVTVAAEHIALDAGDLGDLPPAELLRRQLDLVDLAVRAMAAEMTVAADAGAIVDGLAAVIAGTQPGLDARRLAELMTVPVVDRSPPPDASAAVFAGPTWAELGPTPGPPGPPGTPGTPAMPAEPTARRRDRLDTAVDAWDRRQGPGLRRWITIRRVERLADEAARQLARRERAKTALLRLGGAVRRLHLEMGGRLVAAGRLRRVEEVELLTVHELRAALLDGWTPLPAMLERRRRSVEQHEQWGPLPPEFTGLPEPVELERAVEGDVLIGWPASPGRFDGTARRLDDPQGTIGADEVLVAAATNPSWSPLLMRCGAMVIERGGPLSHAAILAREFGVPAVFNVPGAAVALDGHRVRVDGDEGTVRVLDPAHPNREGSS